MAFWVRRKLSLAPNDPLYLGLTDADIETEYWAHRYYEDPKLALATRDDNFDADEIEQEVLSGDWEVLRDDK